MFVLIPQRARDVIQQNQKSSNVVSLVVVVVLVLAPLALFVVAVLAGAVVDNRRRLRISRGRNGDDLSGCDHKFPDYGYVNSPTFAKNGEI